MTLQQRRDIERRYDFMRRHWSYMADIQPFVDLQIKASTHVESMTFRGGQPLGVKLHPRAQAVVDECQRSITMIRRHYFGDAELPLTDEG